MAHIQWPTMGLHREMREPNQDLLVGLDRQDLPLPDCMKFPVIWRM